MRDAQRHDSAVAFCCDRNYFPFALFMIWQIGHHNPNRRFDFVIATRDDLEIPAWAKGYGIVLHRLGEFPHEVSLVSYRGSQAPLFRLMLSRELGGRYRRILSLDCDMFVEGGDFNRLIEIDLGPHPIAAVVDAPYMYDSKFQAKEFIRLGWPALPYANAGLQLMDTRACLEQDVEERSFAVVKTHRDAIVYSDQSLTNIALRGKFAQLAPCWNWQWDGRFPLLSHRYPVLIRHFIGGLKPDRDSRGALNKRFKQAYIDFMTQLMPEELPKLSPFGGPTALRFKKILGIVAQELLAREQVEALLARYPDPYKAVI